MNSSTLRNVVVTAFLTPWQTQNVRNYGVFWISLVFSWGKIAFFMFWEARNEPFFWEDVTLFQSWDIWTRAGSFSLLFVSSSRKQVSDMRPRGSPLPLFSGEESHFSCFGGCQKRTFFLQHAILPQLFDVWTPELEFISSSHTQVSDMRARESPLPSTNSSFNLGWFGAETGKDVLFKWTHTLSTVAQHQKHVRSYWRNIKSVS